MAYFISAVLIVLQLLPLECAASTSQLNFTVEHFTGGSNCQGTPLSTLKFSKTGLTTEQCVTNNIPTSPGIRNNTPMAYEAYCFTANLAFSEPVGVLKLDFYFDQNFCDVNGDKLNEKPLSEEVTIPGFVCFQKGSLFPDTDVKVYHPCGNPNRLLHSPLFLRASYLTFTCA